MAADQVVCPLFGVVFERLNSLIYKDQIKKFGPLVGLVKELKKLLKTFFKIKQVLSEAEEKQFKKENEEVRLWLQELNDAAYEAKDVFDKFEYEALQLASQGATSINNVTQQLHGKIQRLIEIFQELAKECSELDLQKRKEMNIETSITIHISIKPRVYGRDEDREKLVKQLLGSDFLTLDQFHTRIIKHPKAIWRASLNNASSSSQGNISVFSILGIEGLGKTTLAQLVYNDKRVENHFEVRSWIRVSDNFNIKRIMRAFITSVSGSECDLDNIELLQRSLQTEVHGKRFLLVLDDLREERQSEWNKVMGFFRGGAQSSSIIVTTRLKTVADVTSTLPPHCLNILSQKDSWALFKQYAFGPGNEERPALVTIGEGIVKKCRGLPSAAKAMGESLRFINDEKEWIKVKDNAIWELPQSTWEKDVQCATSIKGKLDSRLPSSSSAGFCRVSTKFGEINEYLYTPEIIRKVPVPSMFVNRDQAVVERVPSIRKDPVPSMFVNRDEAVVKRVNRDEAVVERVPSMFVNRDEAVVERVPSIRKVPVPSMFVNRDEAVVERVPSMFVNRDEAVVERVPSIRKDPVPSILVNRDKAVVERVVERVPSISKDPIPSILVNRDKAVVERVPSMFVNRDEAVVERVPSIRKDPVQSLWKLHRISKSSTVNRS